MSLIDDALKRAREQAHEAASAGAAAPSRAAQDPWAYAPLPSRRRSRKPFAIGAGAAVAIAAGVFIALHPGQRPRSGAARSSASGLAAPARPVSSPAPTGSVAEAPASTVAAPRPAESSSNTAASAAGRERPGAPPGATLSRRASEAGRALAAAPPSSSAAGPRPAPAPPAGRPPPARLGDGRTYTGELTAPNGSRVELGGIVYSETSPVALLNGRVLPVGGVIEGLTIAGIEENRVTLRGEDVTVYLTLK